MIEFNYVMEIYEASRINYKNDNFFKNIYDDCHD